MDLIGIGFARHHGTSSYEATSVVEYSPKLPKIDRDQP
jgi:hypothetical protein